MKLSIRSLFAFAYLIIFGSLVGYTAYIWLLKNADPLLVATYAYVNPVIALILGMVLAGEMLTLPKIFAAVVVLFSVVIITVKQNKRLNAGN